MTFEIIGDVDPERLYCTGSFSKFMTTYVTLSLLAEKYDLRNILDDDQFFDSACCNQASKDFLQLFQSIIGSRFSIRDVCSFYDGLPYTFDAHPSELEAVDTGLPFKHHGIMDEQVFLDMCRTCVTLVDPNRCKFHYSEVSIIFLGYLIEKIYSVTMDELYQKFVMDRFGLKRSVYTRYTPHDVDILDLSPHYDYPSISIQDHGYFSYSNGFFTTLTEHKQLLEQLITTPAFQFMSDINTARAASRRIMNGLTLEIRKVGNDILYGYEGLSYSGCNIWAYSTLLKKGYLTTTPSEEDAYTLIYGQLGYENFDIVPEHTELIYHDFLKNKHYDFEEKPIPRDYIGQYQRVNINETTLDIIFTVGHHFIEIRNPDMIKYDVLYDHGIYRIACKDHMHGTKVGFYQTQGGNRYMLFDGTLYKRLST